MRIVALAGLPGTGKSTLARALGRALGAPVLDKDALRVELFGREGIEYSRAQDDRACRALRERAAELLASGVARDVVLDGRTYSRAYQVEELVLHARAIGAELAWIECVASEAVVRARLARDAARAEHPAANRGPGLYAALARAAEPLQVDRLVVDSGAGTTAEHVARVLAYLAQLPSG